MFERYTETARRLIFWARYQASVLGADSITPEHLLIALLQNGYETLQQLTPMQFSSVVNSLAEELKTRGKVGTHVSTSIELPFDQTLKQVLSYAKEEADNLHDRHIGEEHLLLGMLRLEDSSSATMLRENGVELETVRELLQQIRGMNKI